MLKAASEIIEGLRHQPLVLALVLVNLLFLVGFTLMLREVSQAVERRDALISDIAKRCVVKG